MTEKKNNLEFVSLLEIGDHYIQASWSHPESSTEIIAIYRDVTKDNGREDFVLAQPIRGPWSTWDAKTDSIVRDYEIAQNARAEASDQALRILDLLNQREGGILAAKKYWDSNRGIVYDY